MNVPLRSPAAEPAPAPAGPCAPPAFVTLTGADERTDPGALAGLAAQYPIEVAVLFSDDREGREPRYPVRSAAVRLARGVPPAQRAAHLCGHAARLAAVTGRVPGWVQEDFARVQLNVAPGVATDGILRAARSGELWSMVVLQHRGAAFPAWTSAEDWAGLALLFDRSGGRGELPSAWPPLPPALGPAPRPLHGYAGGLNAENVRSVLDGHVRAAHGHYWLDAESGLRDAEGWFSVDRARAFCAAIFDAPAEDPE